MWKPTDRRGSCVCVRARACSLSSSLTCAVSRIYLTLRVFSFCRVYEPKLPERKAAPLNYVGNSYRLEWRQIPTLGDVMYCT